MLAWIECLNKRYKWKLYCYKNGIENNNNGEIVLKNHVWIAADVLILSNTMVGNDNIIATRNMVKGLKSDCNKLIVGSPASTKEET